MYGKLTILGFLGISPNVDVAVQRLDQPTVLTFLILGGPGAGMSTISFDVFDQGEQRVVAAVPPGPLMVNPNTRTSVIASLVLTFGHPGTFSFRCYVDGAERFHASFRVSAMASA